MSTQQYLLTCLAEECAEVAQRATKAIRFGMDEVQPGQQLTNFDRLQHELNDLMAVADLLGLSPQLPAMLAKVERVWKYYEYSQAKGQVV